MIRLSGRDYAHLQSFKHDFFAVTALYEGSEGKIVLKVMRQASVFGLPLRWLGGLLLRQEVRLLRLTQSIDGIPRLIGRWGPTGLAHEFVEGRPLVRQDRPNDLFFPRLAAILNEIHARGAAYVDLEKRENILLGTDGAPYLIDFQISWHVPTNRGGETWVARLILRLLQESDRYHLLKHWRRLRPDQLETQSIAKSYRAPFWISWHRAIFGPFTRIRRQVLVWLGARSSAKGRSPG